MTGMYRQEMELRPHDGTDKSATVEALGPLIESLEGMGAQILPIDEDTQVIQYVKADTVE